MRKIFCIILCLCSLLLHVPAQEVRYTLPDTATAITDSLDEEDTPLAVSSVVADTLLVTPWSISKDSVMALKNTEGLTYLERLDTLLRQEKAALQTEIKPPSKTASWLVQALDSRITMYFFWALGALFVLFILYRLFISKGVFQRTPASNKMREIKEEEKGTTITDYALQLRKAIEHHDYRLAVRYLYLQLLRDLSEKGQIHFAPEKTNQQYLQELKDKQLRSLFSLVTLHYEYTWFGKFDIDEARFNAIREGFNAINIRI